MASVARCGFTIVVDGEEEPCDREATGWRWYQGHDHEDMLDEACWEHENVGGNRMHALCDEVDYLRAEVRQALSDRIAMERLAHERLVRAEAAEARLDALVTDLRSATEWRDVREFGSEHTTFSNGARKMAAKVRSMLDYAGAAR